ncbi:MAG TPA: adenylate/guanylate cyclase domain-containing protein [Nannocystis sp.]
MPERTYDPALTRAHLSNRFALGLIHYFSERFGEDVAERIVEDAGLSLEYLRDPERWISVEFDRRFCDAAAFHLCGLGSAPPYDHPMWLHWRDASATMLQRQEMGPVWLLLWAMEGPGEFFADIERMYGRGNRITRMQLVERRPGAARIRAVMEGEVADRPGTCWTRRGFFEAVPTIWNLPPARVEHTECIHQDPKVEHCCYDIFYEERVDSDPAAELQRLRGYVRATLPDLLRRLDLQALERRDTELTQRKLASYLPAHVVEAIRINPEEELRLGGRLTEGAVLFADVKDFTGRCSELGPDDVVRQLNLFFEHIDAVILDHGGIIDKRIGDGIMVVFIDPRGLRPVAALAAAAVRCGLAMLAELPRCNAALIESGGRPLELRIGVAAGPLVHGNMGSRARLEHTVIGRTVNLAARLEAAATPGRLLTLPECVRDMALGSSWRDRVVFCKGLGDVAAVELTP